jgi:hypothetical protein
MESSPYQERSISKSVQLRLLPSLLSCFLCSFPVVFANVPTILLSLFIPCCRVRYRPYYLRWEALPMRMDGGGRQVLCRWDEILILQYVV